MQSLSVCNGPTTPGEDWQTAGIFDTIEYSLKRFKKKALYKAVNAPQSPIHFLIKDML